MSTWCSRSWHDGDCCEGSREEWGIAPPAPPIADPTLPAWVLTEEVDVTVVHRYDGAAFEIYLLERALRDHQKLEGANAITITFDDGTVALNGMPLALTDAALEALCSLVDSAGRIAAPDNLQPIGKTIRTQAERTHTL